MNHHQQRVSQEKADLDLKIASLATFLNSPDQTIPLPDDEYLRMKSQLLLMRQYSKVLGERIAHFML